MKRTRSSGRLIAFKRLPGAEILLDKNLFKAVVKKGMDPQYDSYSGFQDDGGEKTDLDRLLKRDGIRKLVVYGIATDYCVRATALDGVAAGYKVVLIKNLCRGVAPDTSQKAIEAMKAKGIVVLDDLDLEKIMKGMSVRTICAEVTRLIGGEDLKPDLARVPTEALSSLRIDSLCRHNSN